MELHKDELMANWKLAEKRKELIEIEPLKQEHFMFLHVVDCQYVNGYILRIKFNTNEEVEIDLKDELEGSVFEPLKSLEYFRAFKIREETNTIEWPNGAGFAPEFLREQGKILA